MQVVLPIQVHRLLVYILMNVLLVEYLYRLCRHKLVVSIVIEHAVQCHLFAIIVAPAPFDDDLYASCGRTSCSFCVQNLQLTDIFNNYAFKVSYFYFSSCNVLHTVTVQPAMLRPLYLYREVFFAYIVQAPSWSGL